LPDDLPSGPQRLRVKGMASCADLRLPYVFRLSWAESARRRAHDPGLSGLYFERAVLRPKTFLVRGLDHKSPDETLSRAELVFGDLMTERTGHAVRRQPVAGLFRIEWQMRENLAFAAAELRFPARHRHVADGALVLDRCPRFGMIHALATHRALPVGVPRGVCHHARPPVETDRDVLARGCREPVVAGNAAVGSLEVLLVPFG